MNRLLNRSLCVTLQALGVVALGAAIAQAQADTTLRVGLNADIRSTEPGVNRDENTDTVMLHIVEGLVAHREDASVGPLLAREVQVSDDGLTYTFKLREGVRFHNGATLTAADVKWTWSHYLNPQTQWRCLAEFDGRGGAKITNISTPDPLTVVFQLDQPSGLFLASMARPDCGGGGILHPDSVAADGRWKAPIGTGPFTLAQWKPGQSVELARFKDYSARDDAADGFTGKKQALVDTVRFMIIPDAASAKAALLSNNVDLVATCLAQCLRADLDPGRADPRNLLGGIAVLETVFTLPGIGRLMVDAIFARDYPVLQGCLLLITFIYVLVNLCVDLLYPLFDPRVKL